jgi:hypothetical protein
MKATKGMIIVKSDGTVTIKMDSGAYCLDHFTNGVKRFLDTEIEILQRKERYVEHGEALELNITLDEILLVGVMTDLTITEINDIVNCLPGRKWKYYRTHGTWTIELDDLDTVTMEPCEMCGTYIDASFSLCNDCDKTVKYWDEETGIYHLNNGEMVDTTKHSF